MFEIKEIFSDKRSYLDLLLIGDEQEDMIDRYIDRCRLFIGFDSGIPCACCAITMESHGRIEVKNLAVNPEHRRKGYGRRMLQHIEGLLPDSSVELGTGETPSTLLFYHSCGYRYSHRIHNFFTDNYDHPIIEEGVTLRDMVYLTKNPRKSES